MNLLLILAVIFGTLVLVRLANVAQLASKLSGENDEEEQDKDNRINSIGLIAFLIIGMVLLVYMIVRYSPYMLPVAASEHGVDIDKLMNLNWLVVFAVFFLTQILLFSFAFKYKFNKNRRALYYHDNNKLEVVWTIIPTIVLASLITTGMMEWNKITNASNKKDGMVIQLYAKQFDWTVRYSGKDNTLGKSNFRKITDTNPLGVDTLDKSVNDDKTSRELYLPAGIPIELVINSRDVIHSAYLPHFRVQMNAVPGMSTRFHFKPTITTDRMRQITGNDKFEYILLCNKICGVAHYNMKMKVVVVSPDEFKKWLKDQAPVLENNPTPATAIAKPAANKSIALN
jgi:cytochrome c oxidase subunit 2